jgi:hypothetical protein
MCSVRAPTLTACNPKDLHVMATETGVVLTQGITAHTVRDSRRCSETDASQPRLVKRMGPKRFRRLAPIPL